MELMITVCSAFVIFLYFGSSPPFPPLRHELSDSMATPNKATATKFNVFFIVFCIIVFII